MLFTLKIENFGKLSDAEIRVGQFTVFAGPNNTGKSFVSKLLYSLFDGMNANHALVHFYNLVEPLRNELSWFKKQRRYEKAASSLSLMNDEIDKMENLVKSCSIDDLEEIRGRLPQIIDCADKLQELYKVFEQTIEKDFPIFVELVLESTRNTLNELSEELQETDAEHFVLAGIQDKILQNLIQNFQVAKLSHMRTRQEEPSKIFIDNVGTFEFQNNNLIHINIEQADLQQLQDYSRVIYLESPVYWKLHSALESVRISPRFSHYPNRERLSGVPGYFYDLAMALREEYSGDIAFPELYEKLISKEVLRGKITISETGELNFQENGHSFSLHLTAMGVVNLGILALLIERKIIDKGAFIFIDEPEAHLHPAWQVTMVETLLELSRQGVNVVIATHSADILKFLEVETKKSPENQKLIALNHFSHQGIKNSESDFEIKLADIQKELTEPYSKLYIRGV